MANVMEANESNFHEEVLEADKPVLVDFWAPWCGYCQRLSPIIDELSTEIGDKVKIMKVNVDSNRALAQKHGVMSLPTMLLFKNGEAVEKLMGFMPKDNITAKIMPLL
ncbi:MAG: thioredoxin [Negativicutes bacterium]|nr:thioredoxin [Negativicutes bacterium]